MSPVDYSDIVRAIKQRLEADLPVLSFTLTHVDVQYDIATQSHRMFVVLTRDDGQVFSFNNRLDAVELINAKRPMAVLSDWVRRTAGEIVESVKDHNRRRVEYAKDAALAALET